MWILVFTTVLLICITDSLIKVFYPNKFIHILQLFNITLKTQQNFSNKNVQMKNVKNNLYTNYTVVKTSIHIPHCNQL